MNSLLAFVHVNAEAPCAATAIIAIIATTAKPMTLRRVLFLIFVELL